MDVMSSHGTKVRTALAFENRNSTIGTPTIVKTIMNTGSSSNTPAGHGNIEFNSYSPFGSFIWLSDPILATFGMQSAGLLTNLKSHR
jgi:hypothetical protein